MWPFVFASGRNAGGVGPFCKVLRQEEGRGRRYQAGQGRHALRAGHGRGWAREK
ncbi:hypothetical protein [Providencia sp. PROV215]|uniref:hypothetical protein n=1 Tax=Providencia sp. PROV215 TaxID=2949911 RepID=UPI00234AD251|nr:hypothetical protein [Providencia sp. PROV215]